MVESGRSEIPPSQMDEGIDPGAEIASLRLTGADRMDPARFRFIEALARRAGQHRGDVKRILDGRLTEALAAYRERLEQVQDDARETIARMVEQHPDAADDLQRLFVAGDFRAVSRFVAKPESKDAPVSVAGLTRYIEQHSPEDVDGYPASETGSRSELKTLRYFRDAWSRLSVSRQVKRALEHAPEHAGPLNSHLLVLRSLALMRDISPDYLNRLVSYVDTLLWLDQAATKNRPMPRRPSTKKTTRK